MNKALKSTIDPLIVMATEVEIRNKIKNMIPVANKLVKIPLKAIFEAVENIFLNESKIPIY